MRLLNVKEFSHDKTAEDGTRKQHKEKQVFSTLAHQDGRQAALEITIMTFF